MELISVLSALLVNLINLLVSILYTNRIMKYKWRDFIKKFYLMMLLRFTIILSLFFYFLKILKMDELALSLTFILSYFIVLIIEILYLNKRYNRLFQKQAKEITKEN